MQEIYLKNRAEWRGWLAENHASHPPIWLIYYKKETGKPTLEYDESVEEALCFGWVDSIIRKLDDERFARKFTPRKETSNWSESNKQRVEKLMAAGLMTEHGLRLVEQAKQSGLWREPARPDISWDVPAGLQEALARHPKAAAFFESLAPSYRKQYIGWIAVARRPETREKRIAESISLLEKGEKLGMK